MSVSCNGLIFLIIFFVSTVYYRISRGIYSNSVHANPIFLRGYIELQAPYFLANKQLQHDPTLYQLTAQSGSFVQNLNKESELIYSYFYQDH